MDTVTTGGISSWGSLIKLGGVEAVSYAVGKFMDGTEDAPAMTVEDCISVVCSAASATCLPISVCKARR